MLFDTCGFLLNMLTQIAAVVTTVFSYTCTAGFVRCLSNLCNALINNCLFFSAPWPPNMASGFFALIEDW